MLLSMTDRQIDLFKKRALMEGMHTYVIDLYTFVSILSHVKGGPQNRGLFDRKFKVIGIGRFWRLQNGNSAFQLNCDVKLFLKNFKNV